MESAEFLAGMTAVGILSALFWVGRRVWQMTFVPRRNRKWILQQPSVSDAGFLHGCGIKEDSEYAELALTIRRTLAAMYDLPIEKITSELLSGRFIGLRHYNDRDSEEYFEKVAEKFKYPNFTPEERSDIASPNEFLKEDIPVKEFVFSFLEVCARYQSAMISGDFSDAETEAKP